MGDMLSYFFFFQAEDGIRDIGVTGVQTCALPISASSWHPWVIKGKEALPIQEDETALVVWALWRHYYRYRDIEFIRPIWVDVVQKAADFMVRYRDQRTGLPLPSYDLWEERWGVHAFTVATVYGGLRSEER